MRPPQTIRDVQRLNGKIAALSRFVSKSAEKCLPFFKILRDPKGFSWSDDCQAAFDKLKEYLASPPLISKPKDREDLYLYLAATSGAVSAVLVREEDKVQRPVYYVSKALNDAEWRYPEVEKFAYALIISARKLRPYFQAHTIKVLTDQPLRQVLAKPDTSGRLIKWSVELGEYDVKFEARPAIKSQVLADFVGDNTPTECMEETPSETEKGMWKLSVDGSSCLTGSGAGLVLTSPDGWTLEYALRFKFKATNNEAEWEALVAGLTIAKHLEVQRIEASSDSQLVVGLANGEYEAREDLMAKYLAHFKGMESAFEVLRIVKVPRAENVRADQLSKLATAEELEKNKTVLVDYLERPTISQVEVMDIDDSQEPNWMTPFVIWLRDGILPEDQAEARKLVYRANRFQFRDGILYKRSFSFSWLRCLNPSEADYALREVHEGICGNHTGGRTLSHKLLRQGYYWPTMHQDAINLVRKCDKCQRNANISRRPSQPLTSITAPWPFAQWGMDFVGPLPMATGQRKFLIVAVDYFTKWVEAEPLATITEKNTESFVWKSIICRFGVPKTIITNNGKQFDCQAFRDFCREWRIEHRLASVAYPQSNGQAEVINREIISGLKKRLEDSKGRWTEELPSVLWAYRTTPRITTGESPYSLCFGAEAMIPVEVGVQSPRVVHFTEDNNEEGLRCLLDLVGELRDKATIRVAAYQERVSRYYNKRVSPRPLRQGDLVLRNSAVADPTGTRGKLAPAWEGPYKIKRVLRPGTFKLETLGGREIARAWNAEHLRKYYQ
ncbi:rve domain-containing protein/RVT_3 domain-containing protein [Cephalotus follicularis]|uniref:Rve domain-containing protein/RVT_3 domain-containing protein n=1 Tax=Cephalotus follicularis TaxID=3775 RepID=A0A1Q3DGF2_CEPFO|nr:rve domain-containing protein/RVT_3 domain-containing protein [Cephalotus follicularis]